VRRCVTLSPSFRITRLHIVLLSSRYTTRVYTIGTGWFSITHDGKPSGRAYGTNRTYTSGRVVKAEGLGDRGLLPHGFESLRISM